MPYYFAKNGCGDVVSMLGRPLIFKSSLTPIGSCSSAVPLTLLIDAAVEKLAEPSCGYYILADYVVASSSGVNQKWFKLKCQIGLAS